MAESLESKNAQQNNLEVFLERGPGLSYSYQTWVVARDRERKRILLGGLGGMGCGEMWVTDDGSRSDDESYAAAPERDSWCGFGTPEYDAGKRATPLGYTPGIKAFLCECCRHKLEMLDQACFEKGKTRGPRPLTGEEIKVLFAEVDEKAGKVQP